MSGERRVVVYPLPAGDGRWTWRVVDDDARLENGPAYHKTLRRTARVEAGLAALNLFPETPIEIEA